MFNGKLNEEYKNIKAPEELYERIINSETEEKSKNNVIPFRKITASAAAVALIILSSFIFLNMNKAPSVYLGSEKLTGEVGITEENNMGFSLARSINEINCSLTFEISEETKIFLSEGLLFDSFGDIILEAEEEGSFNESFSCLWTVSMADENRVYEIKLTDKNGAYFIKLEFDRQENIWTACLTK